jgi:uncharacterized membrane protein
MMKTQILLLSAIAIAAILAIAPLVSAGPVDAKKHKVCPGTGECHGASGDHNPNAYCTTNGVNRPNCAGT